MIYFDHSATSPLLPSVRAKLHALIDQDLGNASSLHSSGRQSSYLIEEARAAVAKLINAEPEEIIFTSGGSESNNTVVGSFAGQTIAVSQIEHPSVLAAAHARAREVIELAVDRWGRIDPQQVPQSAQLVSVMLANNELGTLEPIRELVKCCKKYNIYVHSDATQALGKIPVDVQDLGVDYLTISAHKIGGPLGVGALYVRQGSPLTPLIYGGHQEHKRRAGTSNVLAIAGFGEAARYVYEQRTYQIYADKIRPLRDQLRERILREIPYSSANTPSVGCLPHLLNMSFQAAEGESIQLYLDTENIAVSTGSACAAGDLAPSHVLMATRGDAEVAHNSIRFSLGLDATAADIDAVMAVLPGIIQRLQGISTVKIKETS